MASGHHHPPAGSSRGAGRVVRALGAPLAPATVDAGAEQLLAVRP